MNPPLSKFYAFLDRPLRMWARFAVVLLIALLPLAFLWPLWKISMEAPQYPGGLYLDIYAYKLVGGNDGQHINEINTLNHYIGMRPILPEDFDDLDWMPFALGFLAILALRTAAIGNVRSLIDMAVVTFYVLAFLGARFIYRLYVYGHDLDPHAAFDVEPFMPVIIGTKQIANFTTHSHPQIGSLFITVFAAGIAFLTIWHLVTGRRAAIRAQKAQKVGKGSLATVSVASLVLLFGCAGVEESSAPSVTGEGRQYVFVTARESAAVHVFDFETLTRVTEISVAAGPQEVQATPDGTTVWVVSTDAGDLTIIDAATLGVRHRAHLGARPVHSFVDPSYERVFVGNDASSDISVVDLSTGEEQRVLTGNGHHKMAIVTDDAGELRFVYVSNIGDATITVLDPSLALVANVSVGPAPHGMDYSHVTRRVYNCSGDAANSIEILSTEGAGAHTVVGRIPLPARCGYLHVEDDGRHAYATLAGANLLARIDLVEETVETFAAGESPDKLAIDGDVAWVANVTAPTVTGVDLSAGAPMVRIDVGRAAVDDGRGHRFVRLFGERLFVPNQADDSVSVVDTTAPGVMATLDAIGGAFSVAVAGPLGGTTYPR